MKTVDSALGRTVEREAPQHPGGASRGCENVVCIDQLQPLEAPSSIHPIATALPANTDPLPFDVLDYRQAHSSFLGKWGFWRQR